MKKRLDAETVDNAERRALQATEDFYGSWKRVKESGRLALTRPSSLLMVSAATGLIGFALVRRSRHRPLSPGKTPIQATPSVFYLLLAFLARQGMHRLIRGFMTGRE